MCLVVLTACGWYKQWLSNHFDTLLDAPSPCNLRSVLRHIMLSNALLRLIRTIAIISLLSIALKIWPVTSRVKVLVEWLHVFGFLLWWLVRLPCWVRKSLNWFKAIFSVTLKSNGSNEIWRFLLWISWSPSFMCSTTSDFFQALGNAEQTNERFTSPVKVGDMWGKQSLITSKGILSYPGALFEGIAMNTFRMSSLVTALNSNSLSQVCDGQRLKGMERFVKSCDWLCRITSCLLSHRL